MLPDPQTDAAPSPVATETARKPPRLLSIDALRGFDMLLIAGGGTFIELLKGKTGLAWVDWLGEQLTHPAWHGFTFYDFIFPLFLFLAGVSIPFSLRNSLERGVDKAVLYRKALRRWGILFLLGILDKNVPLDLFDPAHIRFGTVLGRIGLAGFVATVLFLNFSTRQRLLSVAGILVAYYAALFLIPVPGYGAGDLSFEGNLVGWFDRTFMPGRLLQKTYDELALLTQFPAMCLTIIGTVAGEILVSDKTDRTKLVTLIVPGLYAIAVGVLWGLHFPINKHLWSSSFILLTAGMALNFLALFYGIIDVLGYRRWAFFFKVIGMNSIVVYLAYRFIDFDQTSQRLFGGLIKYTAEQWHDSLRALGSLALVWTMLYILYRTKIFVKI
ncbi:acyltransferase family protein [Larkinella sp. VNQ87]|uniref:acyltransferase family protein n=1 Tax=Larkinella sp. VNQ87 TaxID=3400921 RepID=UPI003C060DE9